MSGHHPWPPPSKRRVVMFDLDGVLADFYSGYRVLESGLGLAQTFSERWDDYWNAEIWAAIKTSDDFWVKMPPLASREELLRISDMTYAHDVYFVTNRRGKNVKLQTERWLRMRGILSPTVVISADKAHMAAAIKADFAIDDKFGNVYAMSTDRVHAPKSYLLHKPKGHGVPHNEVDQTVIGGSVIRVGTVNEFLDEVMR